MVAGICLKKPDQVWHNQCVAVGKDPVFGWVVLTDNNDDQRRWLPIDQLEDSTLKLVRENTGDKTFPQELGEFLTTIPPFNRRRLFRKIRKNE